MIEVKNKANCTGCHACAALCPKNCIHMIADGEGFLYPSVQEDLCVCCGLCEKVCPVMEKAARFDEVSTYACFNKNEEIRMQSSSGGIFTLLAERVLQKGGVVFGAAFTEEFQVAHSYTETTDGLAKLRGSKYTQSTIGDTYRQAEDFLKKGRYVLFTGTPCQIGGLLAYLKIDYKTLITQDIICHGVPSPKIWEQYMHYREKEANARTKAVSFRSKVAGWKNYTVEFQFADQRNYRQSFHQDLYMKGFLADLCLRPSCYQCRFKGIQRQADITLADFWGIQNVMKDMDDDKGTSLVLVHSPKGQALLDEVSEALEVKPVNPETALKYNPSALRSPKLRKNRNKFIRKIHVANFEKMVTNYTKRSFIRKCLSMAKRILKKVCGK